MRYQKQHCVILIPALSTWPLVYLISSLCDRPRCSRELFCANRCNRVYLKMFEKKGIYSFLDAITWFSSECCTRRIRYGEIQCFLHFVGGGSKPPRTVQRRQRLWWIHVLLLYFADVDLRVDPDCLYQRNICYLGRYDRYIN